MSRPVSYDQVPLCPSISLARALRSLQQSEVLCDLVLYSDDHKKVHVHKAVFAAMSGYLSKRLKSKQPCTSFIVTGISVEGIRSLAEFVYGNVYAIHGKNADEIYPIAVLFEFTLLQKVCEYINPEVSKQKWTNKIIPVSPTLFHRKPMGPKSAMNKKSEEDKSATPDSAEESSEEEPAPAAPSGKTKRPAIVSPSVKEPEPKKTKREENKPEKSNDDSIKSKQNKEKESDTNDATKTSIKTEDSIENDPKLKHKLEIRLERVDPEKYGSPKRARANLTKSPTKAKAISNDSNELPQSGETGLGDDVDNTEKVETPKRKARTTTKPKEKETNEEDAVVIEEDDDVCSEVSSPKRKTKAADSSPSKKSSPEKNVYECGRCKCMFDSLSECNRHMFEEHNIKMVSVDKNFICSSEGCGFSCQEAESLKSHVMQEHPESLIKKIACGICDAEFDSKDDLESHCSTIHINRGNAKTPIKINGKDNDDEPEMDTSTGELKVTNRPGPKSSKGRPRKSIGTPKVTGAKNEPDIDASPGEPKVRNRPGPKSSKGRPRTSSPGMPKKSSPGMPKVAALPLRTETKIVDGQKLKITYVDDRTVRVEDDSLLEGWSKLLVARRDFSKYDFYIQSANGKRFSRMNTLHDYLDKHQIEMETEHISFSMAKLMHDAGIPYPSGSKSKGTPKTRSKPGPKSSKKKQESSDEEMEVDEESDEENGDSQGSDDDVMEDENDNNKNTKLNEDNLEQDKDGSDSNGSIHKVEIHIC